MTNRQNYMCVCTKCVQLCIRVCVCRCFPSFVFAVCSCNPLLSVHPNGCDPITGNCACRQGIDLERDASCDHCLDGFRQDVVRGGCIPCGCHAYGSVNASCDDTSGDCTCIDGVESRDCSECAMNTQYLSENGCM